MTRSVLLPADVDETTEALLDPLLLTAWVGPWQEEPGTGRASVTTDDGIVRHVEGHGVDDKGDVRWSWHPADEPGDRSDVVITITPVEQRSTLVTITETTPTTAASIRACAHCGIDAPITAATTDRWLPSVLALGALFAARRSPTHRTRIDAAIQRPARLHLAVV